MSVAKRRINRHTSLYVMAVGHPIDRPAASSPREVSSSSISCALRKDRAYLCSEERQGGAHSKHPPCHRRPRPYFHQLLCFRHRTRRHRHPCSRCCIVVTPVPASALARAHPPAPPRATALAAAPMPPARPWTTHPRTYRRCLPTVRADPATPPLAHHRPSAPPAARTPPEMSRRGASC